MNGVSGLLSDTVSMSGPAVKRRAGNHARRSEMWIQGLGLLILVCSVKETRGQDSR